MAVRRDVLGPDQGTVVLPRRLAVPPGAVQPGSGSRRTWWPTRTSSAWTGCSRRSWPPPSLLPGIIGGLVTWSWTGALSALFWAGLVRIALLHHVTWSINSVCHVYGERPFDSRDKATNFWPLAILSFGENWHNLHHADPTCARHGVLRGQIDMNARLIWIFEKLGWVSNVRWPKLDRLQGKMVEPEKTTHGERDPLSRQRRPGRQNGTGR